eukprot:TRINITY_DN2156_c0_g1_i2.p1 TRINITY_DN2156_c0_g1~~TRINITY_DN2156_c0_g1_i2.p1  ORF type:complete len:503 (-),score=95.04 TRINITY_DN2156_c0_g1_i2:57-1565(-)
MFIIQELQVLLFQRFSYSIVPKIEASLANSKRDPREKKYLLFVLRCPESSELDPTYQQIGLLLTILLNDLAKTSCPELKKEVCSLCKSWCKRFPWMMEDDTLDMGETPTKAEELARKEAASLKEGKADANETDAKLYAFLQKIETRFDKMDARFDKMDAKLAKMDTKLDRLSNTLRAQTAVITNLGQKVERLGDGLARSISSADKVAQDLLHLNTAVFFYLQCHLFKPTDEQARSHFREQCEWAYFGRGQPKCLLTGDPDTKKHIGAHIIPHVLGPVATVFGVSAREVELPGNSLLLVDEAEKSFDRHEWTIIYNPATKQHLVWVPRVHHQVTINGRPLGRFHQRPIVFPTTHRPSFRSLTYHNLRTKYMLLMQAHHVQSEADDELEVDVSHLSPRWKEGWANILGFAKRAIKVDSNITIEQTINLKHTNPILQRQTQKVDLVSDPKFAYLKENNAGFLRMMEDILDPSKSAEDLAKAPPATKRKHNEAASLRINKPKVGVQ